jgi:hypothetical protein
LRRSAAAHAVRGNGLERPGPATRATGFSQEERLSEMETMRLCLVFALRAATSMNCCLPVKCTSCQSSAASSLVRSPAKRPMVVAASNGRHSESATHAARSFCAWGMARIEIASSISRVLSMCSVGSPSRRLQTSLSVISWRMIFAGSSSVSSRKND